MEPKAHLFVCTHYREKAKGESCAARGSIALRNYVKLLCKGMPGVRINTSGCLDRCQEGITAVLYPEGRWITHLGPEDKEVLKQVVEESLRKQEE